MHWPTSLYAIDANLIDTNYSKPLTLNAGDITQESSWRASVIQ